MKHEAQRRLPRQVYDLAIRLGANMRLGDSVLLKQTGRMRQTPGSDWMKFRATQSISAKTCAFEWCARAGPLGLISVRDAMNNGEGVLDVRAFGFIQVAHVAPSPALTRGELMRYLAEIAWAPQAILSNVALRWRTGGADCLIVSAGEGDSQAEVSFTLNSDGRIATAFAADRPRGTGDKFTPRPWLGRFADYRRHGGFWLPFSGEVSWVEGGSEFVYWQGRIETWELQASARN